MGHHNLFLSPPVGERKNKETNKLPIKIQESSSNVNRFVMPITSKINVAIHICTNTGVILYFYYICNVIKKIKRKILLLFIFLYSPIHNNNNNDDDNFICKALF